jgi:hypothetical protein
MFLSFKKILIFYKVIKYPTRTLRFFTKVILSSEA